MFRRPGGADTTRFIVAHTERALLHTLVTGVTYREPALLAKAVTTLNVLSGGRFGLGIGAAWNDEESEGLGFAFPPTAERFERLEEAIQICVQMWSGSQEPFAGKHYQLGRTMNVPQSLSQPRPYLMIGGSGEKKTLRLVAQYADACNIVASPEAAHKLDVLKQHCDTVGRDFAEIDKTTMLSIDPTSTADDVVAGCEEMAAAGFTAAYVYAKDITEPDRIIDLLADVQTRVDR